MEKKEESKGDDTAVLEEKKKVIENMLLSWWIVKKFLFPLGRHRSGKFGPRAKSNWMILIECHGSCYCI